MKDPNMTFEKTSMTSKYSFNYVIGNDDKIRKSKDMVSVDIDDAVAQNATVVLNNYYGSNFSDSARLALRSKKL
jgi:hypothetical protein